MMVPKGQTAFLVQMLRFVMRIDFELVRRECSLFLRSRDPACVQGVCDPVMSS